MNRTDGGVIVTCKRTDGRVTVTCKRTDGRVKVAVFERQWRLILQRFADRVFQDAAEEREEGRHEDLHDGDERTSPRVEKTLGEHGAKLLQPEPRTAVADELPPGCKYILDEHWSCCEHALGTY